MPGCAAVACNCTSTSRFYWSASPVLAYPPYTWVIAFVNGGIDDSYGLTDAAERAVRGPG